MIPGLTRNPKKKDFRRSRCQIVGCTRRARHSWAYPCAVTTMMVDPATPRWILVCDDCDVTLNETLMRAFGVPDHVIATIIPAYRQIQADGAFQ